MPLDKTTFKADVKQLLTDLSTNEGDQDAAFDEFADGLANAIDTYIKTATITATPIEITAAALSNGGGVVVAANNLISVIS
jgi:hypothetical protein